MYDIGMGRPTQKPRVASGLAEKKPTRGAQDSPVVIGAGEKPDALSGDSIMATHILPPLPIPTMPTSPQMKNILTSPHRALHFVEESYEGC